MAIWITSDWHFNHDQPFIWQERGFNSIQEMNEAIVRRHNSCVELDDDVYVLGDLCMSADVEDNKRLISQMRGKLHIILGNHDTSNRIEMYKTCPNVIEVLGYAHTMKYKKYIFYLSHYPVLTGNNDTDKPLKTRVINLHAHTHQNENFNHGHELMYHVGMDSHKCFPVLLDDAIEEIKENIIYRKEEANKLYEKILTEIEEESFLPPVEKKRFNLFDIIFKKK